MANVGKGNPSDPDRGWSLYIVSVVMVIFSGLFIGFRIAVRLSKKMIGADDAIIIAVCSHVQTSRPIANGSLGTCKSIPEHLGHRGLVYFAI